ncbi:hypothetical protein HYFRA_00008892 [Hymenoscyphus fraxineus]|uniref:Aquaporin-like protein n=1 Tax=Hymenoscyphus fraxineus TaxID=746836 RepID=A0A9N9KY12_9HELO|nr:hypothetical protein HYFRA_00008892 [Hymenoscyphus fraxineus]
MNINKSPTVVSRVDPLKHAFENVFEALPEGVRDHVVAAIGEFLGTFCYFFFTFAGGESAAASISRVDDLVSTEPSGLNPALLLYIATSGAFSLAVNVWIFFPVSGGLFNPLISFGMALIGAITWARCALLIAVQTAASIAGAYVVYALFNGGLHVETTLRNDTTPAQGVVVEMLLTAQVILAVFMLASEKHEASFIAPIGIGFAYFISQLVGIEWTGASLNPIRSLAPCIVNRSFTHYHWIYWAGPITGTILAVVIYKLVKALEYETAQEEGKRDETARGEEKVDEYPTSPTPNRRLSSALPSVHSVDVPSAEPKKAGEDMPVCYAV